MGRIRRDLLSYETQPNTHTMHMGIYPQTWLGLLTGTRKSFFSLFGGYSAR